MALRLHDIRQLTAPFAASAVLSIESRGRSFLEITREVQHFLREVAAGDGVLFVFLRHTSASLVIQENADPDVRSDLVKALDRLAPEDADWVHDSEGPDDMPSHVKTMLTGVSLHVPVEGGALTLGTWQGIYLAEHRARPHSREVRLQFIGTRQGSASSA